MRKNHVWFDYWNNDTLQHNIDLAEKLFARTKDEHYLWATLVLKFFQQNPTALSFGTFTRNVAYSNKIMVAFNPKHFTKEYVDFQNAIERGEIVLKPTESIWFCTPPRANGPSHGIIDSEDESTWTPEYRKVLEHAKTVH